MKIIEPRTCIMVGDGSLLIGCSEILLNRGYSLRGVRSDNKEIHAWASANEISCFSSIEELQACLLEEPADYLFSIYNLNIIPDTILSNIRCKAINFHDGLLPRYAGLNTPCWSIIEGAEESGISWIEMVSDVDQGAILKQVVFQNQKHDTSLSLNARNFEAGLNSFEALVDDLETGQISVVEAVDTEFKLYLKNQRPTAACMINWNNSAEKIDALCRAVDFGPYPNNMGIAKSLIDGTVVLIPRVQITDQPSQLEPGQIVSADERHIRVATGSNDVTIESLLAVDGRELDTIAREKIGVRVGSHFSFLDSDISNSVSDFNKVHCTAEDFWVERLSSMKSVDHPFLTKKNTVGRPEFCDIDINVPEALSKTLNVNVEKSDVLVACVAIYLAIMDNNEKFSIGISDGGVNVPVSELFSVILPLLVNIDLGKDLDFYLDSLGEELKLLRQKPAYLIDIIPRYPELKNLVGTWHELFPVVIQYNANFDERQDYPAQLIFAIDEQANTIKLRFDKNKLERDSVELVAAHLKVLLEELGKNRAIPLEDISLVSEQERHKLLHEWNDSAISIEGLPLAHQLFEQQVESTPDAIAVVFETEQLTYRELNERANCLANRLTRFGVSAEEKVAICVDRSLELSISVLAVLKAGGAYVPIDPDYPEDRIAFMVSDCDCQVVIARHSQTLPAVDAAIIMADSVKADDATSCQNLDSEYRATDLAYMIYTSGSTGTPKGVMLEHGNLVNFIAAMDEKIDYEPPGVWLAATSLSFDISILELLWTLCRGFKVVIYKEHQEKAKGKKKRRAKKSKPMEFSLFYFSAEESYGEEKYRLLLEGAKYADEHKFSSVWTPERHFHAFGGIYPNPSLMGSAIAAITEHVKIRAGSCVAPLHHPARIAEEWSVVDNLSNGRAGVAIASGWQPNDFVLMPQNFDNSKSVMIEQIDTIRRLWSGESVAFDGPKGPVNVRTLPRPVQSELPISITTAGNPETFRLAGELGAGILTHLLGQTAKQVKENVKIYREAWAAAGHSGDPHVTLMLHTFLSDNKDFTKQTVREPLKAYLRTSTNLVKQYAAAFPTMRADSQEESDALNQDFASLDEEQMDQLLEFSVERYYETSGLFGTPQEAVDRVNEIQGIGVDEIACLIDFGVETELTLKHLDYIRQLRDLCGGVGAPEKPKENSIAAAIDRHNVTHFQCTPSQANMILTDPIEAEALSHLQHMYVGGEAITPSTVDRLRSLLQGTLHNFYGPTETTIWSTGCVLDKTYSQVPIGRPLANNKVYLLDEQMKLVPIGEPGELYISGLGLARGYFRREELTKERFLPNPFSTDDTDRYIYRTGDRARYDQFGNLYYMSRIDNQIKIRGYRIEPGEIEAALASHELVKEAAVISHAVDENDVRIAAYATYEQHGELTQAEARRYLRARLPDYMVPNIFVAMDEMPKTPNGKLDRKALPNPYEVRGEAVSSESPPQTDTEKTLATIWQSLLKLERIDRKDNFYDLGGHSLLAVKAVQDIKNATGQRIDPRNMFFQTLEQLASKVDEDAVPA